MDHDILTLDWNTQTLLVLSRQQVKEALDWLRPDHPFDPGGHLRRHYGCGEADLGYVIGIIETRLDRELGIWVNLRRALDIAACLDGDANALTARLHGVLVRHFQLGRA
ncbi:MAG TPA: hypothetical protein VK196_15875 [Magnetospirillum sp.]|nr:hypothetical protein [Magnetospirillum sp.]